MSAYLKKIHQLGIFTGILISTITLISILYTFHKTIFIQDLRAEINDDYVQKSEIRIMQELMKEMRQDIKTIQKDVKAILLYDKSTSPNIR